MLTTNFFQIIRRAGILIILMAGICISCTKKQLDEPECNTEVSYEFDIKPITDQTCAIAGCHVAGFPDGDYTTYTGFKLKVDNGMLENRALILRNMPPSNTAGPTSLTEDEIELFSCWIQQGALNN